jgi:hypothetical protein
MPRADGTPTILELIVPEYLDEAGRDDDPVTFLADLEAKLGHTPSWEEIDTELGLDRRALSGKTWPQEEDCPGCDGHRDKGPHRFSCHAQGGGQLVVPMIEVDGKFKVDLPGK